MIHKPYKINRSILTIIAALFIESSLCLASWNVMSAGYLVQSTPFDHKIESVTEQTVASTRSGTPESLDSLFIKAKSIRYVADKLGTDTWQTPAQTELRWAGDCEDKALWLFYKLKQNGFSGVRLVIGRFKSASQELHVWITLSSDKNDFYILDPTSQKRIWKSSDFPEGYYKPMFSFDGSKRYRHEK